METGPKQHTVPQQMIRRFANERNQLRAMRKSTLTVSKRARGPKGILWKEDYYKDTLGDLDAEWLTPIEQEFAKYYPALADAPWRFETASKEEGVAFVNWALSQLFRTDFIPRFAASMASQECDALRDAYATEATLTHNVLRLQLFEGFREVYTQPGWKWGCSIFSTDANLILTDHPVCSTPSNSAIGHVIFVPLSKKRIMFGGSQESLDRVANWPPRAINCILASWAEEWIYAADEATLLEVARELKGEGSFNDSAWLEQARKPLFGLPKRAAMTHVVRSENVFDVMKRHYSLGQPQ